MNFRQSFFHYYDRAIGRGICSFSQTGIKKNEFTLLCTDPEFVLSEESLLRAMEAMKMTDAEKEELLRLAGEARKQ